MDPSASISYEIVVACCFSIVLSVLFFGLRLLSRWLQEHKFDTSDLLLGIGLLVALGFNADLLWGKSELYPIQANPITDPAVQQRNRPHIWECTWTPKVYPRPPGSHGYDECTKSLVLRLI